MHKHVTMMRPEPKTSSSPRFSAALPPDLLEQVRGRVVLLAKLMVFGFVLVRFSSGWDGRWK